MKFKINTLIKKGLGFLGSPLTLLSSVWLKFVARRLIVDSKTSQAIFSLVGTRPINDHYYQPLINPKKHLKKSLREDRLLPGINYNIDEQLALLKQFDYNEELLHFPMSSSNDLEFYYNNIWYKGGDAEYLYSIIRRYRPKRIIEIGSGLSTLMARNAIEKNCEENNQYSCEHICIEPYERDWLGQLNVEVIRKKVEDIDVSYFQKLSENDILFIDSSHIIRPQGDVLFEYLELLPTLQSGVLIHIHDIFTPKDYLDKWVYDYYRLWNEQYLLEAFLSFNKEFRIIGSLNHLSHHHPKEFTTKCPIFEMQPHKEPQAFWIVKN